MDGSSSLGVSDNDDSDSFEWDSDDNVEAASFNANTDAPGPSSQAGQSASLVQKCREMGFAEEVIHKAIKDNGDNQEDTLFPLLVAYQEEHDCHNVDNGFASGCVPQTVDVSDDDDDDIWDDMDASGGSTSDASSLDSSTKEFFQNLDKVQTMVGMGISKNVADLAITRCGKDASIDDLVSSIFESQTRAMLTVAICLTLRITHMEGETMEGPWMGAEQGERDMEVKHKEVEAH